MAILFIAVVVLGLLSAGYNAVFGDAAAEQTQQAVQVEQVESVSGDEAEETVAAEEETVDAAPDGEVNESEGEIRMIPAPEEAETSAPTETEEMPSEEPAPTEFE